MWKTIEFIVVAILFFASASIFNHFNAWLGIATGFLAVYLGIRILLNNFKNKKKSK